MATNNLINNGSFGSNAEAWTVTGQFQANSLQTTSGRNSSPGHAYLSGFGGASNSNNLDGTVRQSFTLPANATAATLSYWYQTTSTETFGGQGDWLKARLLDSAGNEITTLATHVGVTNSSYLQSGPFNLLAYAGQKITLSFDGHTNATMGTAFRFDDVSLNVTTPDAFISPTPVYPGTNTTATTGLTALNAGMISVRWNFVDGAAGYGVKLEKFTSTGGPFGGGTWSTAFDSETYFGKRITGTTLSIPTIQAAGVYRWSVRAFTAPTGGTSTAYSPALAFQLNTSGFTRPLGVDISHWQGTVNWSTLKNNNTPADTSDDTQFAWVKASDPSFPNGGSHLTDQDNQYQNNTTNARAQGVPIGGYYFGRPGYTVSAPFTNTNLTTDAIAQADQFTTVLAGELLAGNLLPVLDFEDDPNSLSKAQMSLWANAFCERLLANTGLVPLIYTGGNFAYLNADASLLRFPLWVPDWPAGANPQTDKPEWASANTTPPWPSWNIWQWTASGSVGSVSPIDRDVLNGDIASLAAFKIPTNYRTTISGKLFDDRNGNDVQDGNEVGWAGRTVFIDANGNNALDAGEPTAVSDAQGNFVFANLLEGSYRIRQVVPAGYETTVSGSSSLVIALLPGQANASIALGSRNVDQIAPTVLAATFHYETPANTIELVFSEDVGESLSSADATLTLLGDTPQTIAVTLVYNAATKTAIITPTNGTLTAGNYTLSFAAGAWADAALNNSAAYGYDFFALPGDINRDREVNFGDLLIVAQNYGTGTTFTQGDLNGDGQVNFGDLLIVAQSYGTSTPIVAAATAAAATTEKKSASKRATQLV